MCSLFFKLVCVSWLLLINSTLICSVQQQFDLRIPLLRAAATGAQMQQSEAGRKLLQKKCDSMERLHRFMLRFLREEQQIQQQVQELRRQIEQEMQRIQKSMQDSPSAHRSLLGALLQGIQKRKDEIQHIQTQLPSDAHGDLDKLLDAIGRNDFLYVMYLLFHGLTAQSDHSERIIKIALLTVRNLLSLEDQFQLEVNKKMSIIDLLLIKQAQLHHARDVDSADIQSIEQQASTIAMIQAAPQLDAIKRAIHYQLHDRLNYFAWIIEQRMILPEKSLPRVTTAPDYDPEQVRKVFQERLAQAERTIGVSLERKQLQEGQEENATAQDNERLRQELAALRAKYEELVHNGQR